MKPVGAFCFGKHEWRMIVACGLSLSACVADMTPQRVQFRVLISGVAEAGQHAIATPSGWQVTLTRALVGVGPCYFRNAVPAIGTGAETGRVVGQVLALATLNALSNDAIDLRDTRGPEDPGDRGIGFAVTEAALQAEIYLHEPSTGELADASRGRAIAWVAGVATRGDVTVNFDGFLAFALPVSGQEIAWQQARRIRRIPADFLPFQDGVLRIRVDPSHWLDAVDFASLPESGATRDFSTPAATTQLRTGIHNPQGITFAFE